MIPHGPVPTYADTYLSIIFWAGLVVHALLGVYIGNGADSIVILRLGIWGWQIRRLLLQLLEEHPLL